MDQLPSLNRTSQRGTSTARIGGCSAQTELFRALRDRDDRAARERLVRQFMPLARGVARRYEFFGSSEDLRQVAYLGLVKAIDRFDPDRGTSFASYAVPTIAGEIRRYLRDYSWGVHMPRGFQERVYRLRQVSDQLTGERAHASTVAELAAAIETSPEAVRETSAAAAAYDIASLDDPPGADASTTFGKRASAHDLATLDGGFDRVLERDALRLALASLPERHRQMIGLRFFGGLTQAQIAAQLGVSQMQVCRALRQAMQEMRQIVSVSQQPSAPASAAHDCRSYYQEPRTQLHREVGAHEAELPAPGAVPHAASWRAQANGRFGWRQRAGRRRDLLQTAAPERDHERCGLDPLSPSSDSASEAPA